MRAALLAVALLAASSASAQSADYDEAVRCSQRLAGAGTGTLTGEARRRCIVAVATTYIEGEQNSIPPDKELLADDVARHLIGTPRVNAPGGRAKIIAAQPASFVIGAIRNRRWTVDGDDAWILYDGYLKADMSKPGFYVAERITVEKGLISEIMIAAVAHPE
jgi:hypothetical protein